MKRVKIVFTDLDFTLTKEPGIIDKKNKEIFKKLKDKNIHVVIDTGRPLSYIIPICKEFCTSKYVITSNGAEIYDIDKEKLLYRSLISKEDLEYMNQLIVKYNLYFMANSGTKRYSNKDESKYIYATNLIELTDISQVVLESYDKDIIKKLNKEIDNKDSLIIINQSNIKNIKELEEKQLYYCDIVNSSVSKGIALEHLCNLLNISLDGTMAIGDSGNDIEMLKKTYYKVAVGNATEALKSIANIITLTNKENGVYDILNKLYEEIK